MISKNNCVHKLGVGKNYRKNLYPKWSTCLKLIQGVKLSVTSKAKCMRKQLLLNFMYFYIKLQNIQTYILIHFNIEIFTKEAL